MMSIQGLCQPNKSWGGCHHSLIVYDASKLSTVYVVKPPVLGLQRVFENSVFPPSVQSFLARVRIIHSKLIGAYRHIRLLQRLGTVLKDKVKERKFSKTAIIRCLITCSNPHLSLVWCFVTKIALTICEKKNSIE